VIVRTGHGARLVIDFEVIAVESARHRRGQRQRLDHRGVPRLGQIGSGLPAPVRTVAQRLHRGRLVGQQLGGDLAVTSVAGGQRVRGDQPALRLGRDMPLYPSR
jgi:hypothetical protein